MNGFNTVIIGTAILAAGIFVLFMILVLRRFLSERNKARRDRRATAITRSYLQRVSGQRVEDQTDWSRRIRLDAIRRILPLLRGGERKRLLQIAELDGVLAQTIRNSHSIYGAERINAIHLLQRFGSEVCIARLRQLMAHDKSLRVRLEAAFALGANGALPPPRETLRILHAIDRAPTRLDVALLRATAPLYPEQMVLLLEDDLPADWRAKIIDALGWSGDMSMIELLAGFAVDPESEIRCAALRAAGKFGHPAAAKWIVRSFADPVAAVRLQAIAAAVELGLREALPELQRLRGDGELWVRLRAEQALDRLDSDDAAGPAITDSSSQQGMIG